MPLLSKKDILLLELTFYLLRSIWLGSFTSLPNLLQYHVSFHILSKYIQRF